MAEVVALNSVFNWSLSQLATEFGISRETVTRRINSAGIEPAGTKRGHPVYRVRLVAEAILKPAAAGGTVNDPETMTPKERSDWFRSENDRLKFERDSGISVDSDDVRVQMAEIVKMGLSVLETLPDVLERDFNLDPEIISKIEGLVDDKRNEWADKLEQET